MSISDLNEDQIVYETEQGTQVCGDSREVLEEFPDESIDLIVTSPPFALLRKKSYGNKDQGDYVEWLLDFGRAAKRPLKPTGSFVLDLGGAYQKGRPVRSLYNYRVLLEFCDTLGYRLAQEFFWFNPSKLPSPIEWVNKRKIRVKDSVNTVWWFSKEDFPEADNQRVLVPYSDRMEKLLEDPDKFYDPKKRPSGHEIGDGFGTRNDGAIPPNLLEIPNSASNSHYLRTLKEMDRDRHPARFPKKLPAFFVKFLTEPGALVVDIFSGSNTTGAVAEQLDRKWVSIEKDPSFAALSVVRFMEDWPIERIEDVVERIETGSKPVRIEEHAPETEELSLPLE